MSSICGFKAVNPTHCINEKTGKCTVCNFNTRELDEAVKQVVIQHGSTLRRLADS